MAEIKVKKLFKLSMESCAKNLHVFCTCDRTRKLYSLSNNVFLSAQICHALLKTFEKLGIRFTDEICHIFADREKCQIIYAKVPESDITDDGAEWLLAHNLIEADFAGCRYLTPKTRISVNKHGKNLKFLSIGQTQILNNYPGSRDWVFELPALEKHNLKACNFTNLYSLDDVELAAELNLILQPLYHVTFLDITSWPVGDHLDVIMCMTSLRTLILADVHIQDFELVCGYICHLKKLQVLDLSNSAKNVTRYADPETHMKKLVESLPALKSLDISGTNLACLTYTEFREFGGVANFIPNDNVRLVPWLCNRQLEFLGLMNCFGYASEFYIINASKISANRITGITDERQLITALEVYVNKPRLMIIALERLEMLLSQPSLEPFSFQEQNKFTNYLQAFKYVSEGMRRNKNRMHLQLLGCNCICYIFKCEAYLAVSKKRETLSTFTMAVDNIIKSRKLMRNGTMSPRRICEQLMDRGYLTPAFSYNIMEVGDYNEEMFSTGVCQALRYMCEQLLEFIENGCEQCVFLLTYENIVIHFLRFINEIHYNSNKETLTWCLKTLLVLNRQHASFKESFGKLGGITMMISLIKQRTHLDDKIKKASYSILLNAIDQTPLNAKKFINMAGVEVFLNCLTLDRYIPALIQKLVGVLSSVVVVPAVRQYMVRKDLLCAVRDIMINSTFKYNNITQFFACSILCHIIADGALHWTITDSLSKKSIEKSIIQTVNSWTQGTQLSNIVYSSLVPFLDLLSIHESVAAQYWSAWTLCNLITTRMRFYCPMLEKENGYLSYNAWQMTKELMAY